MPLNSKASNTVMVVVVGVDIAMVIAMGIVMVVAGAEADLLEAINAIEKALLFALTSRIRECAQKMRWKIPAFASVTALAELSRIKMLALHVVKEVRYMPKKISYAIHVVNES